MICQNLTGARAPATSWQSEGKGAMRSARFVTAGWMMMTAGLLSGCINVAAPSEPIVIELNINIRQEVIYRLAEDAANTVEANEDIF